MILTALLAASFACGMIIERIDDWRVWLPFAALSGFLIGGCAELAGIA